ncbi:hypothetical protein RJ639_032205 [Escallonia herrerae]|uniref:Uncharacterized protein n=1 Tax=Escallonia herrerae TaxID=1293975 RepID=A0AA88X1J0_9ASTE|nr:hypothetical protein RJ639_032205 [Escallonia herrerae]
MSDSDECTTPKYRIPAAAVCPPAPRKKVEERGKKKPPKNGYFHPPDLDMFFAMEPRRGAAYADHRVMFFGS